MSTADRTVRQARRIGRQTLAPLGLAVGAAALLLGACGGEQQDERLVDWPEPGSVEDPGSGSYQCPVVTDQGWLRFTDYAGRTRTYELDMIEDWETGAGSGWYTNNPQCTWCEEREKLCDGYLPIEYAPSDWGTNQSCNCPNEAEAEIEARNRAAAEAAGVEFLPAHGPHCPARADIDRLRTELTGCWQRCREIQDPSYFEKPLYAYPIPDGGRCGSTHALHLRAGPFDAVTLNFQGGWGGVIGKPLAPPYDAGPDPESGVEGWHGICFWARRGPQSRAAIRVDVSERHSDDKYVSEDGGPLCNPHQSDDHTEEGCDKFGAYFVMDGDWKFFAIPFTELRQAGWGRPADYFDVWGLMSLGFAYNVGYWDFWIDDIAFYRMRPQ